MRSMAFRSRYREGEKQFFQRRFAFGGMFGAASLLSILRRRRSLSYPLSPFRITAAGIWSSRTSAAVQSATWPAVSRKARERRKGSVRAWTFVVRPRRAADRLAELPTLPPAEQRRALTAEEWIKTCSGGPLDRKSVV